MIDFTYTPEQQTLYDTLVHFAKTELSDNVISRDRDEIFATNEWEKCGQKKIHGLFIPTEFNGLGYNAITTAFALEAIAFGCDDGGLLFSIAAQLLSCTLPIYKYGTYEQKQNYLSNISTGKLVFANAMTEKESGSDAFSLATNALKQNDDYVLNGQKVFISNAPNSNYILLYAITDSNKGFFGGVSAFLIDSNEKGVTISEPTHKMGLRSCLMGEINFENVILKSNALLGKEGAGAMIFTESMQWERALLGAIHLGTMKRILNQCIEYVNTRTINQKRISEQQIISHRISEMYILIETTQLLVQKVAFLIDTKSDNIALQSSVSKVYTSDTLNIVCDLALLIYGGNGYKTEYHIERYKRDAVAAKIYSGTNDIQKNIIAKWLGL